MEEQTSKYPMVLSVHEVARILGVTDRTVRLYIKAGVIPGIKMGRLYRVPKNRLIECLDNDKGDYKSNVGNGP